MSSTAERNRSPIIVGTDFSDASHAALDTAWTIATGAGAPLLLTHVISGETSFGFPASEELRQARHLDATASLERRLARPNPIIDTEPVIREGKPADELAALARETGAALVVIGSSDTPAPLRWLTGDLATALIDRLPCDLLIADRFASSFRRILVPVDDSGGDAALGAAIEFANAGSAIDVVDVSDSPGDAAAALIARWSEVHPRIRQVGEIVRPANEPTQSHNYDLIAVAARERSWLERLFTSSPAEELVDDPPCSVLVVTADTTPRRRRARSDSIRSDRARLA